MTDPYYCKLYIDVEADLREVKQQLDRNLVSAFGDIRVEAPVFRNEDFSGSASMSRRYDFLERSKFYVELGALEPMPPDPLDFQLGTIRLISSLRDKGWVVTASCEFEDLIAAETGWNWTEDTPDPPRM